jgi:hypothetical protein
MTELTLELLLIGWRLYARDDHGVNAARLASGMEPLEEQPDRREELRDCMLEIVAALQLEKEEPSFMRSSYPTGIGEASFRSSCQLVPWLPLLDAFAEVLCQGSVAFDWSSERVSVRYSEVKAAVPGEPVAPCPGARAHLVAHVLAWSAVSDETTFETYAELCRALEVDLPRGVARLLEALRDRGPGPLTRDFALDVILPLSCDGRHGDEPQDTVGGAIRAFELINAEQGPCLVPHEYLPIGRDADHTYFFLVGLRAKRAGRIFGSPGEGQGMLDAARHEDFDSIASIEEILRRG